MSIYSSKKKNLEKRTGEPLEKSLTLEARFENLDRVRDFVGEQAEEFGLDDSAVYAVQLAVDEAFSNIVEHAFGGECEEEVECTCQFSPDGLIITLLDCGEPFNPLEVAPPDLASNLEDRQVGGLGLYFMRRLMDEISFTFIPGPQGQPGCNFLKMVKRKEKAA